MSKQSDAAQMAAINTPPPVVDPYADMDPAAASMAQFVNWQGNVLSRLGLLSLTGDVKADNPTLLAALNTISLAGAPEPTITKETVAWPGGSILPAGAFTVDVYSFYGNGHTVKSTEFLLAANPQIIIRELKTTGVIRS